MMWELSGEEDDRTGACFGDEDEGHHMVSRKI
jgi:hypothetical protein